MEEKSQYSIEEIDADRVVIHIRRRCDMVRTSEQERQLRNLVARFRRIACEFPAGVVTSSDWLRWFARLTVEARHSGKVFALVGLSDVSRKTADLIGLEGTLVHANSVEEVWTL